MKSNLTSNLKRSTRSPPSGLWQQLAACLRRADSGENLVQCSIGSASWFSDWQTRQRDAYLAQSQDLADLEQRMRRFDQECNELWSDRSQY
jgi:hypothetical protein